MVHDMQIKKNQLQRNDLKHNFLKQIVIRFDFTGISESEIDGVIQEIKPLLRERGYRSMKIESIKEMDFQLDDPETIEAEGIPVREVRQQNVYVFFNEKPGVILKISTVFAFISIEKTKYINFFEYSPTLLEVMKKIQECLFFAGTRFGLRKINKCILIDINTLNKYFEHDAFHLFSMNSESRSKLFNARDCILHKDYNINYTRNILAGELDREQVYQVVLDTDIYLLESEKVSELIKKPELLIPMNDLLFDMYKMTITDEFAGELQKENFCDENIIGVEKNYE